MYGKGGLSTWRLTMVAAMVVAALAVLGMRLVYIQIVDHERYLAMAEQSHRDDEELFARRGAILDANGYPLAISVDTYDVYIYRPVWDDADVALEGARQLAQDLSL